MASPDWTQIFVRRVDLTPPGYQECLDKMRNDPNPRRKKGRRSQRPKPGGGPFNAMKHTGD